VTAVYVGFILRAMFERMIDRVDQAHEDILRMHSEQMRNLTSLSAEIARELRMPLASIAALAGAVRQQIHDSGGAATQLETVREETAHMQALLEEFLNFSRPLSPLSLRTVDGVRIGGEIVDLFQGVAQQRHLSLAISGQPVELRCDPRKIKQVLINLVQNAVDASHPGGEIAIEIEARSQETAIRVVDRGDGISAEIAQRVFQPGVTTKPRAPGLGLTIARSIAEQHGGTLTLRGREGGGCAAELMLPHAPAPAMEGRAA
jgi:signal transduction histidine kinase